MKRSVQKKTSIIDKEINNTNESMKRELEEMRIRLEGFMERIDFLESQIGVSSKKIKKKDSKTRDFFKTTSQLHNIILIDGECDLTADIEECLEEEIDSIDELCTVLLIMTNNTLQGEIVYMKKNTLKHLCENIIKSSMGDKIPFPDYIQTNKFAFKNEEGLWNLRET